MRITRAQRNVVAEKITSLERTFYGRGPRNVQVSVSDDDPVSLIVLSLDSLTVADAVLRERGHREAVIRHHEALHEATRSDFLEAVEGVVGRPATAYLAQVHPDTGNAIRVFVFSDQMHEDGESGSGGEE
ncbi:Na-translocating system protein MpsC family protein [Actinophytocola sp.]|uniref:Na-translocating system protein MpsC family protein n=1 Tax=Actinophytocola sp. TaxID=1872138 RepID=UPI002ED916D5